MDGVGAAVSSMKTGQVQASMDVKVLKEAQDMAKGQAAQLINSLPQAANLPGIGGNIDVTA